MLDFPLMLLFDETDYLMLPRTSSNLKILGLLLLLSVLANVAIASPLNVQRTTVATLTGDSSLRSTQGRDISVIQIRKSANISGSEASPFRILIQGGLHGNEALASEFVLWLATRSAAGTGPMAEILNSSEIDFVPWVNPDGTAATSRTNSRGVNLNRNFSTLWGLTREDPGPSSFSEAETRAIRALFKKRRYHAAIDVHGFVNWIVAPSSLTAMSDAAQDNMQSVAMTGASHGAWMRSIKSTMARHLPNHEVQSGAKLGNGGAFEDWAFWEMGAFSLCLELASNRRYEDSAAPVIAPPLARTLKPLNQAPDTFLRYETFVAAALNQAAGLRRDMRSFSIEIPTVQINQPAETLVPAAQGH
jgi:hypothetical protein